MKDKLKFLWNSKPRLMIQDDLGIPYADNVFIDCSVNGGPLSSWRTPGNDVCDDE